MPIQTPQYPAPMTPSFQSFSARQRMEIDDALAAEQAQKERQFGLGKAGGRAFYEYDKNLRGYMEAKYANSDLTYWDYVKNPSVGGAFRAEGRKKIAEHIGAGGDIDELPGMTFGERHKAGLKELFGKKESVDSKMAAAESEAIKKAGGPAAYETDVLSKAKKIARPTDAGYYDVDPELVGARKALTSGTAEMKETTGTAVETIGKIAGKKRLAATWRKGAGGPNIPKSPISPLEEQIQRAKEYKDLPFGGADPATTQKAQILQQKNIDSLNLTELVAGPQASIGKIAQAKNLPYGTDVSKLSAKAAAGLETGAGETAKAGLKETLGKTAAGLGYGVSIASGAQRLSKGRTAEEKIGGGLQVAGGAAGLVAMTNFWNPVGWAAAIPAALSLGGGLMGGGGSDPLAKTPLGRYRRRVGIG